MSTQELLRVWNDKKNEFWSSQWFGANITSILYLGRIMIWKRRQRTKTLCRPHPSFPPFLFVLINIAISFIVSINVGIIIVIIPTEVGKYLQGVEVKHQAVAVADRDNDGLAQPRHDGRLPLQVLGDVGSLILWSVTTFRATCLFTMMWLASSTILSMVVGQNQPIIVKKKESSLPENLPSSRRWSEDTSNQLCTKACIEYFFSFGLFVFVYEKATRFLYGDHRISQELSSIFLSARLIPSGPRQKLTQQADRPVIRVLMLFLTHTKTSTLKHIITNTCTA